MPPLVSVIIPCYNAERWVREAVDSCLAQTYRPAEVVVVDDGSTDASVKVLQGFGPAIRVETGPNRGGDAARNRGFALSAGAYIQFLDADDYLLPEKVERQVRFLEETRADAVYGDWRHRHHYPDGKDVLGPVQCPGPQADVLESLLAGWWVSPAALLFRREAVARCGGWDETLPAAQDRDFFTAVALSGATVRYQPGCYSVYRRYGDVTVSTANRARWLESHRRVLDKARGELLRKEQLTPSYRRALARSYFLLARNYFDTDRGHYRQLMQDVLSLAPGFRPPESFPYRLVQRVVGFETAERLASLKRRLRARVRPPARAGCGG